MTTYEVQVTDTFGEDANYSWVRNYKYQASSLLGAIRMHARACGAGWSFKWDDGAVTRYDLRGSCICAFVSAATAG